MLTKTSTLLFRGESARRAAHIPLRQVELIGAGSAVGARARIQAHYFAHCVGVLRDYRPGGWRPEIVLRGREHLDRALEQGRGAIVYATDFAYVSTIVRMALHRAGFRLSCLGRPTHPFSTTRLGMRYLNPIQVRIENRYRGERVVLHAKAPAGASLEYFESRLRDNWAVEIYAIHLGRRTVDVPFLGGHMRLATGPAWLAQQIGAPLLPIFGVQLGPGRFKVVIERPVELNDADGALRPMDSALAEYAQHLETYVERYPDQWLGWQTGLVLRSE